MHSHRSSGITSRARLALSRAAAQAGVDRGGLGRRRSRAPAAGRSRRVLDVVDAHQGQQVAAGVDLAGGGVLDQQPQVGLQQPSGVLGPLDVAADPEHRLGDPAQHIQPVADIAGRAVAAVPPAAAGFRRVSASQPRGRVATVSGTWPASVEAAAVGDGCR